MLTVSEILSREQKICFGCLIQLRFSSLIFKETRRVLVSNFKYRVIQNDCRGFKDLSYTLHLREEYMYFFI